MPLIMSQKFSEISFTIYVNAAERLLKVKLWKLKIWNKDVITKEIIVVLNSFTHIQIYSLYGGGVHVKQSFLFKLSTKT